MPHILLSWYYSTTNAAFITITFQISRSAPHSHKNSREVISIVLHPPDDECEGEEEEEDGGLVDEQEDPAKKKRKKKKGESLLLRTVTGRRSTSLDCEVDPYNMVFDRFWVASEEDREILNRLVAPKDQAMQVCTVVCSFKVSLFFCCCCCNFC